MSDRVDIVLSVETEDWSVLGDADSLCRKAVDAALDGADIDAGSGAISIVLATDAELRDLNHAWRGLDKPTNVLSFPSGEALDRRPGAPPPHFGDVILGFETVSREALEQNKSLADHTTHLMVHGVLHLFGYDHELDAQAEIMERLEARILGSLGIADPYLEPAR